MSVVTVRTEGPLRHSCAPPFVDIDDIAPGTSLILAPHPDDETLGCGGLIAACCERGRPPVIVAMTDGAGSHPNSPSYPTARLKELRETELRAAASILGLAADRVNFLRLRDTKVPRKGPAFNAAVALVAELLDMFAVTTMFASWPRDPHGDHEATAAIAFEAARWNGARLLFYPGWGWLLPADYALPADTIRGARLKVEAAAIARKRRSLATHASQCSNIICDDPRGFLIPHSFAALVERDYEVFLGG
jgi:LmbE family N-acetylglucosaminyl deacetylase